MSHPNSNDTSSMRIKGAASALLKGGTLVSEPCPKCGGVQVRLAGKTSCVNCGSETILNQEEKDKPSSSLKSLATTDTTLQDSAMIVEKKIFELASALRDETDTAIQRQKVELLETYLRILEKMRGLSSK
jgi:uncharacterized Zn finger protein (UPF0148 family)